MAVGWLLIAIEVLILAACLVAMVVGLKSNGLLFTEALAKTRRETWDVASALALTVTVLGSCYFAIWSVIVRRGSGLMLVQLILLVAAITMAISFHSAIAVPPDLYSPPIPGP